jgi:hypothetical protein
MMIPLLLVMAQSAIGALSHKFLVFTDVHLDPTYNPQLSGACYCNEPKHLPIHKAKELREKHVPLYKVFDTYTLLYFYTRCTLHTVLIHLLCLLVLSVQRMFMSSEEIDNELIHTCGKKSTESPYGQWHCDAPLPLVQSMFTAAANLVPDPDFVIFMVVIFIVVYSWS